MEYRCEWICDECGKKLNASDIVYHDANGTLCEDCFVSRMIFNALKDIKEDKNGWNIQGNWKNKRI